MTRRVRAGAFWMYSAHAQWYASTPCANAATMGGAPRGRS
jgi:hypothetical protein